MNRRTKIDRVTVGIYILEAARLAVVFLTVAAFWWLTP